MGSESRGRVGKYPKICPVVADTLAAVGLLGGLVDGVLILSEFAGAAHQMRQAVLVNPFDVRALESAIDEAVNGDRRQHRRRMAALGRGVHRDDAAWWAGQFLADLEAVPPSTAASAAPVISS